MIFDTLAVTQMVTRRNDTSIIRGSAIRSEETLGNLMYKVLLQRWCSIWRGMRRQQ